MIKLLGSRGASAAMGFLMLSLVSTGAAAQTASTATAVQPAPARTSVASNVAAPMVTVVRQAVTTTTSAISKVAGSIFGEQPKQQSLAGPDIAKEAAWLHKSGWPLYALVDRYAAQSGPELNEQENCIAVAIYHEARGESVEGQLAVARVVMNRAASGKYPASWCETVKQPWQFSFVRNYQFPYTDMNSKSWRKAVAITRLAVGNAVPSLSEDVLWYHADYVAPSWGRRLTRVNKIGTHIFYRA